MYHVKTVLEMIFLTIQLRHIYQQTTLHNLHENKEMYDVKTVLEINFLTIQLFKTHLSTKYST